jgi:hypothetical protein
MRKWHHLVLALRLFVTESPKDVMRALAVFDGAHDRVTVEEIDAEMHRAKLLRNMGVESCGMWSDANNRTDVLDRCRNATGGAAALAWAVWHVYDCTEAVRVCDQIGLVRVDAAILTCRVRLRPWPRVCGSCAQTISVCNAQAEQSSDFITNIALQNVIESTRTSCHATLGNMTRVHGLTAADIESCM